MRRIDPNPGSPSEPPPKKDVSGHVPAGQDVSTPGFVYVRAREEGLWEENTVRGTQGEG